MTNNDRAKNIKEFNLIIPIPIGLVNSRQFQNIFI